MRVAKAVVNLIEAFERLPGIGPKTAAHLKKDTKECSVCHNIAETDPCEICLDRGREKNVICVVEQPLDVVAMERGNRYKGVYHVLHGVIDPMHNIGPEEIKIGELIQRLSDKEIREVILALNVVTKLILSYVLPVWPQTVYFNRNLAGWLHG